MLKDASEAVIILRSLKRDRVIIMDLEVSDWNPAQVVSRNYHSFITAVSFSSQKIVMFNLLRNRIIRELAHHLFDPVPLLIYAASAPFKWSTFILIGICLLISLFYCHGAYRQPYLSM